LLLCHKKSKLVATEKSTNKGQFMQQLLNLTGTAAGVFGALLCAASGLTRFMGGFYLAGYEATTLFGVGTGIMVFACLLKLESLLRNTAKP
jgi:hypothetical protein